MVTALIVLGVLWLISTVSGTGLLLAIMGVQRLRRRTGRRVVSRRGAAVMG